MPESSATPCAAHNVPCPLSFPRPGPRWPAWCWPQPRALASSLRPSCRTQGGPETSTSAVDNCCRLRQTPTQLDRRAEAQERDARHSGAQRAGVRERCEESERPLSERGQASRRENRASRAVATEAQFSANALWCFETACQEAADRWAVGLGALGSPPRPYAQRRARSRAVVGGPATLEARDLTLRMIVLDDGGSTCSDGCARWSASFCSKPLLGSAHCLHYITRRSV